MPWAGDGFWFFWYRSDAVNNVMPCRREQEMGSEGEEKWSGGSEQEMSFESFDTWFTWFGW
jgi:hypothetical protein